MINFVQNIGAKTLDSVATAGRAGQLLLQSIVRWPGFKDIYLTYMQLYSIGVQSLLIIAVSGLFIGMVLGLQGYTTLVKFGAESALGPLVALSIVRELGPVVAALLFAGRFHSTPIP